MYRCILAIFAFSLLFFVPKNNSKQKLYAKVINDVVAVVGDVAITDLDITREIQEFKKNKRVKKDKRNIRSQVLDLLINRAIIDFVAKEESIQVPDSRVNEIIQKELKIRKISSVSKLKKIIHREIGMNWKEYRTELARQIKSQQVIQLRVSIPSPSPNEIEEWYRLNRKKIGQQYLIRIIAKKPFSKSLKDELKLSKLMKTIRRKALKNFSKTAIKYSELPSASKGGLIGWQRLDQLAQIDPFIAGAVQKTRVGKITPVINTSIGYAIAKADKAKPIPIEKIYNQIKALLHKEKEAVAFEKWAKKQRERISVNIYMSNYQEP